jgi:activator of 2-hydroxyglutaryl-CoA dehydratase
VQAAALADAVAQCLRALAQMMPVLVFAGFGWLLMQSSLSVALATAMKQADVLVTGAFAAAGWLLSSYLGHVDKRFDDAAKLSNERFNDVNKRFDNAAKLSNKRFNGVNKQLKELKELLTQRNSGSC